MENPADLQKRAAAEAAAALVKDGMIVGLGTGSTAAFVVEALGKRTAGGLKIVGIPTSEATALHARDLGIALSNLNQHPRIDLTIDGADEVEKVSLNLIKGRGGALLREKIVASSSSRFIVIVDESKLVEHLGAHFAVPVEIDQFGWTATASKLQKLGCEPSLRKTADGAAFLTDGHHYILDCSFGIIAAPPALSRAIDGVVGVVEHGLFPGMASQVIVGRADGVQILEP